MTEQVPLDIFEVMEEDRVRSMVQHDHDEISLGQIDSQIVQNDPSEDHDESQERIDQI